MSTSEPIHVAFVWHMHQPYYRSARTGAFQMPWARLHAVKDYLDMVEILAGYPTIHQTFNLVPSLVEQLEDYAAAGLPLSIARPRSGGGLAGGSPDGAGAGDAAPGVADTYWEHTIKPAADLSPDERAFIVERMCERPDHPRAKSHPRYLELAQKRQSEACRGWDACGAAFATDELRDLQVWFNLAWCDPTLLETEPLLTLVRRGRDYGEEDKQLLAQVQNDILGKIIPAYRLAAARGQIEVSASPYFHPILPLLANTDSARIGAGETILPRRRFAHLDDAWEQVESGMAKHEQVFGSRPRGMWCSEQSVGEDVVPLLLRAGVEWTISDQTILSRSVAGTAPANGADAAGPSPYIPYLLQRETGQVAIVFRDHTLSDLVGFGYQNWDSRDAANDLLNRIRAIGTSLSAGPGAQDGGADGAGTADAAIAGRRPASNRPPLVTVALDGENAWEYYPHDGRDFLRYLYEGLEADPGLRCVTISEHLHEYPATAALDWLHTGSWIGGDLRTWSGDPAHNAAWDLLHDARDLVAARRHQALRTAAPASTAAADPGVPSDSAGLAASGEAGGTAGGPVGETALEEREVVEAAWRHIMIAEGSDWFWWFGERHHTELDYVWDLEFREHLQEVYRLLGESIPIRLYLPVLAAAAVTRPALPTGIIQPVIDGRLTDEDCWEKAGVLLSDHLSTMQRAEGIRIIEARFGWGSENLYLLLIPRDRTDLEGLELDLTVTPAGGEDESVFHVALAEGGRMVVTCTQRGHLAGTATGAWRDVVEIALPLAGPALAGDDRLGLVLRVGRGGMTDHVFRSAGLTPVGEV
jgi:alpha-amylase/alpha-mannosidase (GH57 family)